MKYKYGGEFTIGTTDQYGNYDEAVVWFNYSYWRDSYGEDADGNRGIDIWDFEFSDVNVVKGDSNLTDRFEESSEWPEILKAIGSYVEDRIAEHRDSDHGPEYSREE
jgi:hypothetical protein